MVCFNGIDISRQCIAGLRNQTYPHQEIIVVDNGSQEDIRGMVSREYPEARLIRLEENCGFAGGYNKGIEAARGEYIAIINNDAVASPEWLNAMVVTAGSDNRIGSVASVIIDGNQPGILDSCGVGIAMDGMSRQRMRGRPVPVLKDSEDVLMASGCACLFRTGALKMTGLFDEDFFAYCEDTDLGLRLRWAGFKTVIAPGAEVTHYYSMTTGKYSLNKIFWVERNHLWVALKNFPFFLLILLPFTTGWRYLVQAYAVLSRSGDLIGFTGQSNLLKVMLTVIKAYLSAIAGMPAMLRKRFAYSQKRMIGQCQMVRTILHYRMSMFEVIIGSNKSD